MSPQVWWYLARASGMVAAILLVGSLVWGVLLATRVLKPIDRPSWLREMHSWLSGLAVVATALHLVGLVADSYVQFGWSEILIPMTSTWRPVAVTLGVIALYLLVLVEVTSLLMKRIPVRWWRMIHISSYALVWTAIVHAGLAGTDTSNRVYQAVALLLTILAVAAAIVRLLLGRFADAAAARRTASAASSASTASAASPASTASAASPASTDS
jgi:hypothetical protein